MTVVFSCFSSMSWYFSVDCRPMFGGRTCRLRRGPVGVRGGKIVG